MHQSLHGGYAAAVRSKAVILLLFTFLLIVSPIVGVCNCSMFCSTLLYVHSSFAIILIGKRELVALLSVSSWCLMMAMWLFLAMLWVFLRFVIVVFPDHTHLLFLRGLVGITRLAERFSIHSLSQVW